MTKTPHGEIGHFNIFTLDQESVVTGYGEHMRVMACLPDSQELYCRVDDMHSLRKPTIKEVLEVAKRSQDVKGKWELDRIEPWDNGVMWDYFFKKTS